MRRRPPFVAIITCLGLAACGGSSHISTSTTSTSPKPAPIATTASATTSSSAESEATTTTTHASAPPEVPRTRTHAHSGGGGGGGGSSGAGGGGGGGGAGGSGASQGAHVQANVTIAANGDVSPPVVSVPSGVGVELEITNHGTAAATVELGTSDHPSAHVAPGGRGTLHSAGLKNGTYRILVNGTPRGQLMIGAQGGP